MEEKKNDASNIEEKMNYSEPEELAFEGKPTLTREEALKKLNIKEEE